MRIVLNREYTNECSWTWVISKIPTSSFLFFSITELLDNSSPSPGFKYGLSSSRSYRCPPILTRPRLPMLPPTSSSTSRLGCPMDVFKIEFLTTTPQPARSTLFSTRGQPHLPAVQAKIF